SRAARCRCFVAPARSSPTLSGFDLDRRRAPPPRWHRRVGVLRRWRSAGDREPLPCHPARSAEASWTQADNCSTAELRASLWQEFVSAKRKPFGLCARLSQIAALSWPSSSTSVAMNSCRVRDNERRHIYTIRLPVMIRSVGIAENRLLG